MNYNIQKKAGIPAYMQLYTAIREDIASGTYREGERLPSKRVMAEENGIAAITVEHTYALLCEEGYVESRERSGYYVLSRESEPFHPPAAAESLPASSARVPESAFPFSVLAGTMRRVISGEGERLLVKSPNNGCAELRTAIARYLARSRGINVRPGQIVIGSGAEYLYTMIVQLAGRENVFALESPSYEKIRRVYEANGIRCDMLPLGPDGIVSEALEETRAKVLHVTPFHSFPSGITASAYKRREYALWAKAHDGLVVEDDFDSEFTLSAKAPDTVFSMDTDGRVIYMNTFSRTIAPSFRVGYMVLPERLLEEWEQRAGFYSCTVPVFDQLVIAEFMQSGDFERHINRVRRRMRRAQGK